MVQGMVVGDTISVSLDFSMNIKEPITPDDLIFHSNLYSCELQEAPDFKWRNPAGKNISSRLVLN